MVISQSINILHTWDQRWRWRRRLLVIDQKHEVYCIPEITAEIEAPFNPPIASCCTCISDRRNTSTPQSSKNIRSDLYLTPADFYRYLRTYASPPKVGQIYFKKQCILVLRKSPCNYLDYFVKCHYIHTDLMRCSCSIFSLYLKCFYVSFWYVAIMPFSRIFVCYFMKFIILNAVTGQLIMLIFGLYLYHPSVVLTSVSGFWGKQIISSRDGVKQKHTSQELMLLASFC